MQKSRLSLLVTITAFLILTVLTFPLTAKTINVQAGICVYPDPGLEGKVYLEFPFAVNRHEFDFLPKDSLGEYLFGAVFAEVRLFDMNGNTVDSANIYFLTRAKDYTDAINKEVRLFNRLSLKINPGVYKGQLTVVDVVSKNEGYFAYDRIEIEPVEETQLTLSSIEFAHKISPAPKGNNGGLIKSGREVIPNPMGLYSEKDTALFIYAELYNLDYDASRPDSFTVGYEILDENGLLYHKFDNLRQAKPGTSSVISSALNISNIDPGRYTLRVSAVDNVSGRADTTRGSFLIISGTGHTSGLVAYKHRFPYDSCGLETKLRLAKYFLGPQDMAMLNGLNDSGKVRFIDQFFRDRDPDRTTEINEFLNDLFIRYIFANTHFPSLPGNDDGWSRDRGRILMQYGNWDDREEVLTPAYGKPYEVWTYYKLQSGGIIFVFQDIEGYGDYKLVHSTATGEVFDSDWDKFMKTNDPTLIK